MRRASGGCRREKESWRCCSCCGGFTGFDETPGPSANSPGRGRGAAVKTLVLIAAQADGRKIGRIRLARIANASAAGLETAVQGAVEPETRIQTEAWSGYSRLKKLGYAHEVIQPAVELGDNMLPRVNLVASLLKRWLLGTHQGAISPAHLDCYLDEFTFRFNRRNLGSRGLLFHRLLEQAVVLPPVRGADLVGGLQV